MRTPQGATKIPEPTFAVTLPDSGLTALFGIADENLRAIEEAFGVRLAARGNEVSVKGEGEGEETARKLLADFSELLVMGYPLKASDVSTGIRVLKEDPGASLVEFFVESPFGPTLKSTVTARNIKQRLYVQTIDRHDLVFAIGPAGTGKTYLAVAMAAAALLEKKVKRIVLARPAVEAGERLGFLPGDMVEKVNPYLRPLYDALYDILGYEKTAKLLERGVIEIAPIAFMRGRTLNDAFIILDEAQNTTSEQMKMFLTRIGFGSRAVVTGDITQVDLPQGKTSGLREAQQLLNNIEGIRFVLFDERDVVRHPLVQSIISAYDALDRERERDRESARAARVSEGR
ncbi:MAG TPA: PhoH family protein [Thermoanaerobaculia bacterium]|nr:PhoH family protein [Thermoanaerobaculia bacterium]